jgi:ketosteroid isomerase-like protein
MTDHNRLIIDAIYTSWEAGDLPSMMSLFSDTVAFAVHPMSAASFIGQGQGRATLMGRLERFLSECEVVDYMMTSITMRADWIDCRVFYHYRHRKTLMEIDGRQRHLWRVRDGKIIRLDIIHDARRFEAFFDLAARTAAVE